MLESADTWTDGTLTQEFAGLPAQPPAAPSKAFAALVFVVSAAYSNRETRSS